MRIGEIVRWSVLTYIWHSFRPDDGYKESAKYYDAMREKGPSPSWAEIPIYNLINYDGYFDERSGLAADGQIGCPHHDEEFDADEIKQCYEALRELRDRLAQLDDLYPYLVFEPPIDKDNNLSKIQQCENEYLSNNLFVRYAQLASLSIINFFADRLKVHLRDQGARHDLIDAVFALPGQDDLLMIVRRVEALGRFLETDDGANLLTGVKRAQNILKIEEKKDKRSHEGEPDTKLFAESQEKALANAIGDVTKAARKALDKEDFEAAMTALAKLRAPVDAFFDKVTVNADNPELRENRLKLLSQIRAATLEVADFSKIEG